MKKKQQTTQVRSLQDLLKEAEQLFDRTRKDEVACVYDFYLGKFQNGWTFHVVNDWHKWMSANRKYEFGLYKTPEEAVLAFLNYVKTEHIDPAGLAS